MPWYSLSLEVTSYISPGVHLLRRRKRKRRRTVLPLKYKVNILRRGLLPHLVQRQEDIQAYQGLWDLVIPSNYSRCYKNDSVWLACPAKGIFRCEAKLAVPWGLPPLFLSILTQLTPALPHQQCCNTTPPLSQIQTVEKIGTLHQHIAHWPIPSFMNLRYISWSCQTNCTICEIFQCETSFAELQVEAKSAAKNM